MVLGAYPATQPIPPVDVCNAWRDRGHVAAIVAGMPFQPSHPLASNSLQPLHACLTHTHTRCCLYNLYNHHMRHGPPIHIILHYLHIRYTVPETLVYPETWASWRPTPYTTHSRLFASKSRPSPPPPPPRVSALRRYPFVFRALFIVSLVPQYSLRLTFALSRGGTVSHFVNPPPPTFPLEFRSCSSRFL